MRTPRWRRCWPTCCWIASSSRRRPPTRRWRRNMTPSWHSGAAAPLRAGSLGILSLERAAAAAHSYWQPCARRHAVALIARKFWLYDGPTLLLAVVIYAAWIALIRYNAVLPWWIIMPVGAYLIAW